MLYSIVIPAHNEEDSLENTVVTIIKRLNEEKITHEILVVNDNSTDGTVNLIEKLMAQYSTLRYVNNTPPACANASAGRPNGYGMAVRKGLQEFKGDAVAVVMADGSDAPDDIVSFYRKLEEGFDCVFGSRFIKSGKVFDYPHTKLLLNRLGNNFIRMLFRIKYDDITNAFKCYKREAIEGIQPLLSQHFELTVEMPLKAIVRGFSYAVLPNTWTNRQKGIAKFKIKELGSKYLYMIFYIWIEKHFLTWRPKQK
jgi:dolichol-phosphate mannosyltransferase